MATYNTNMFRSGLKIIIDGDPFNIVENEFVKPGKGQAFNRTKIKNLKTGRVIDKTWKSGESVEAADVIDVAMEYLYTDGEFWYFMDSSTYEQLPAGETALADCLYWLKEQESYQLILWNGTPISVIPPNFVELQIAQCDPGIRGDTAQGATKPATMTTGATIKVPLFIEANDTLRIDTRTGEYVSRVKT